jgi:hypothetical protein
MDISGIASLATNVSQTKIMDEVQMVMLKKSMDIGSQSELQLIQAASRPQGSNPPHLGNRIDTYV